MMTQKYLMGSHMYAAGEARNWMQNVESLQLYGGFIAMQATGSSRCTANTM